MLVASTLSGICRKVFPWTDTDAVLNIAFGTNTHLTLFQGGATYDLTPTLALPPVTLGANPIATTNASPTVVVTQAAHPYIVGDVIVISGATAVATVTINGSWTVTAITANSWTFTAGSNANATTTGGGSAVVVTPQRAFASGAIDGTGGQGYGTGAYSTGEYSEPSTADFFPLTWSMAAWGQELIACPRDRTIFTWQNNTAAVATAVLGAPARVTYALVAPGGGGYQLFAVGCNEEVSGEFNPLCIRHSSIRDNTEWSTTATGSTAREYILTGGGRLVAAAMCGEYILAWTTLGLHIGTYVGSIGQPWRFDPVAIECGLIGPNAFVVVGQKAFWVGPDLQLYGYALGGAPFILDCPIREGFSDNMAASQGDKIVGSSVSVFNEIRFDYPDARDGVENSRYIAAHIPTLASNPELAWYRGTMARTAFCDAPPVSSATPVSVDPSGNIYWQERGQSADGSAFSWFIETADNYLDAERVMTTLAVYPDFKDQVGPVMVQVTSRFTPQGDETVVQGSTMAPGARKSDVRATGFLHRVKFYGSSSPTACRFGSPIFDVAPAGGR